jgi:hypothetical protein
MEQQFFSYTRLNFINMPPEYENLLKNVSTDLVDGLDRIFHDQIISNYAVSL